jgi:hypothetical protein
MTDWQTYRNGNPREIWNLERLARHRAAKLKPIPVKVARSLHA